MSMANEIIARKRMSVGGRVRCLRIISDSELDERRYLITLSEKAAERGMLTDNDLVRIQSQLFALIARQADKLTRGESSSVTAETAVNLTESVFFTVGVRLKREGIPDRAAELLRDISVEKLFDEGMDDIRRMMTAAKRLQRSVTERLFDTPNVFYVGTARGGIDGFFRLYRPQFGAHEVHITADYPLLGTNPRLDGIEFIAAYLRGIAAENGFLLSFSPQNVHRLLSTAYGGDYAESPVNLCEPVLMSALCLTVLGRSPQGLDVAENEREALRRNFDTVPEDELCAAFDSALSSLGETLSLSARTEGYLRRNLPKLAAAVKSMC